jgi:hypothetical protein
MRCASLLLRDWLFPPATPIRLSVRPDLRSQEVSLAHDNERPNSKALVSFLGHGKFSK